jgi:hypothetical protein
VEIVISVVEQRLALVQDGVVVRRFPVSTSKFGLGDSFGSYKTPLGRLRVRIAAVARPANGEELLAEPQGVHAHTR